MKQNNNNNRPHRPCYEKLAPKTALNENVKRIVVYSCVNGTVCALTSIFFAAARVVFDGNCIYFAQVSYCRCTWPVPYRRRYRQIEINVICHFERATTLSPFRSVSCFFIMFEHVRNECVRTNSNWDLTQPLACQQLACHLMQIQWNGNCIGLFDYTLSGGSISLPLHALLIGRFLPPAPFSDIRYQKIQQW